MLLSGGIDSATVLATAAADGGARLHGLFIDFGQPSARSEARSSRAMADAYGASHHTLEMRGFSATTGEVLGRNALFVHAALVSRIIDVGSVALGIHAGTGYLDCSEAFFDLMSRSVDFHTAGRLSLVAPLLSFSKAEVVELANRSGVPIRATFSCEVADAPCGECLSCRDRQVFVASP